MINATSCDVLPKKRSVDATSVDERLAFERLLTDLSSQFANLAPDQFETVTQTTLVRIRQFLGFDRNTFAEFVEDGSINILSSSAIDGVDAVPLGRLPIEFSWYQKKLYAGESVIFQSPDELPPDATAERLYARSTNMKSLASIPLLIKGHVFGLIAFSALRETRRWPVDLIDRVRLIGEIIAQALERKRSDEKLAAALTEITTLKDRLEQENAYLRHVVDEKQLHGLASNSSRFQGVVKEASQVSPTNTTVLLLGETGSGKEVLAQAIHAASARKGRPMVTVNCAALPASLIESELFGREKGAFTGAIARQAGRFEIADGSTIFLDEIGELPLELQPKLLRVLQEGKFERLGGSQTIKVDVRVIAATNRDLAQAVRERRFREDLYYRLDVFPIELPSLRDRIEDIPLLTWTFVKEFSRSMGKQIDKISPDSMSALMTYSWPGNIRELRNVIERAMILAHGPVLQIKLGNRPLQLERSKTNCKTLDEVEREHIVRALEGCGWRIRGTGGAAEQLGLKPTTLESRMKKLGIVHAHR